MNAVAHVASAFAYGTSDVVGHFLLAFFQAVRMQWSISRNSDEAVGSIISNAARDCQLAGTATCRSINFLPEFCCTTVSCPLPRIGPSCCNQTSRQRQIECAVIKKSAALRCSVCCAIGEPPELAASRQAAPQPAAGRSVRFPGSLHFARWWLPW